MGAAQRLDQAGRHDRDREIGDETQQRQGVEGRGARELHLAIRRPRQGEADQKCHGRHRCPPRRDQLDWRPGPQIAGDAAVDVDQPECARRHQHQSRRRRRDAAEQAMEQQQRAQRRQHSQHRRHIADHRRDRAVAGSDAEETEQQLGQIDHCHREIGHRPAQRLRPPVADAPLHREQQRQPAEGTQPRQQARDRMAVGDSRHRQRPQRGQRQRDRQPAARQRAIGRTAPRGPEGQRTEQQRGDGMAPDDDPGQHRISAPRPTR